MPHALPLSYHAIQPMAPPGLLIWVSSDVSRITLGCSLAHLSKEPIRCCQNKIQGLHSRRQSCRPLVPMKIVREEPIDLRLTSRSSFYYHGPASEWIQMDFPADKKILGLEIPCGTTINIRVTSVYWSMFVANNRREIDGLLTFYSQFLLANSTRVIVTENRRVLMLS